MGFGLFDYAEQHPDIQEPLQEAQAIQQAAQAYNDKQERQGDIDRLKTSILQQLEQGNAPQYILYTAIKVIGLCTADDDWTATAHGYLDTVYSDLAQEALFVDAEAEAAKRLQDQKEKYIEKNRRQLKRWKDQTVILESLINECLSRLACLEDPLDANNLDLPPNK